MTICFGCCPAPEQPGADKKQAAFCSALYFTTTAVGQIPVGLSLCFGPKQMRCFVSYEMHRLPRMQQIWDGVAMMLAIEDVPCLFLHFRLPDRKFEINNQSICRYRVQVRGSVFGWMYMFVGLETYNSNPFSDEL